MSPETAIAIMNKYHHDSMYTLRVLFGQCATKADIDVLEEVMVGTIQALAAERRADDIPEQHANIGGRPRPREATGS